MIYQIVEEDLFAKFTLVRQGPWPGCLKTAQPPFLPFDVS